MSSKLPVQAMNAAVTDALELLQEFSGNLTEPVSEPLPSLLDQCEDLCAQFSEPAKLRSVHHFACSGGSLISKCVALMPNVTLLSEIDPLSQMVAAPRAPRFMPTDLIYGARVALRPVENPTIERMFVASLAALHKDVEDQGGYLVIRDHAHSQFCSDTAPDERPTLREMMLQTAPVASVVTVRHPLDSYLSLHKNDWAQQFTPTTLEGYAQRYLSFLDRHADVPWFRYEDFVADPNSVLEDICGVLDLPFHTDAETLLSIVRISGDSGRRSNRIRPRRRGKVPKSIRAEIAQSSSFSVLCDRLGYSPIFKKP